MSENEYGRYAGLISAEEIVLFHERINEQHLIPALEFLAIMRKQGISLDTIQAMLLKHSDLTNRDSLRSLANNLMHLDQLRLLGYADEPELKKLWEFVNDPAMHP